MKGSSNNMQSCRVRVDREGAIESLELEIPARLPTWNYLLAAGIWERKKVRDLIHSLVWNSLTTEPLLRILTECLPRRSSMLLLRQEYYAAIRARASKNRSSHTKSKLKPKRKNDLSSESPASAVHNRAHGSNVVEETRNTKDESNAKCN